LISAEKGAGIRSVKIEDGDEVMIERQSKDCHKFLTNRHQTYRLNQLE